MGEPSRYELDSNANIKGDRGVEGDYGAAGLPGLDGLKGTGMEDTKLYMYHCHIEGK